jgi:hypothetical protein
LRLAFLSRLGARAGAVVRRSADRRRSFDQNLAASAHALTSVEACRCANGLRRIFRVKHACGPVAACVFRPTTRLAGGDARYGTRLGGTCIRWRPSLRGLRCSARRRRRAAYGEERDRHYELPHSFHVSTRRS